MQRFEAHFQLLELDQTASLEEVRQAYKDLVMVWHPDRFGHNLRLREKAENKLKQVNQAYEHLKQWYSGSGKAKSSSAAQPAPNGGHPPRNAQSRSTQSQSYRSQDSRSQNSRSKHSNSQNPNSQHSNSQSSNSQNSKSQHAQQSQASSPPYGRASQPCITFVHAQYILQRHRFDVLPTSNDAHQDYRSGPFMLVVSPEPLTLTLSVPCTSLQGFDRILLSIPCKSVGHFYQAEAQALLQLLQA